MERPMEFWGVEVKPGKSVKVDPTVPLDGYIHISQVALGEAKKEKASEPVVFYLKVDDQKFVLGTLSKDSIPHLSLDLVLDKESELSHNSKNASVHFCGYKVFRDDGASDFSDSDDESDEDLALEEQDNGKLETKAKEAKITESAKPVALNGASAKQVKIVDPKKDEDESDDESSDDEFEASDEMDTDDDSDEENEIDDESESDEETPAKKVDQGKKRPSESASKTPVSAKKAKNATPEKTTDGKKGVHTATPHPMKKGGKTPNSAKDKTPNSGGQLSCKSCSKSFTSDSGLQQHKKVKHGGQ